MRALTQPPLNGTRRLTGALLVASLLVGCASTESRRDPSGATLPAVRGEALDGTAYELPKDLGGEPAILLVGYVMKAQFDIDRWLLGLAQLETPVRVLEVPTVDGMIPGMVSGRIDAGMRRGIPPADWASVVTLYGDDADRMVELTGNEGARNTRVLLLDGEGRVAWFADRGWSAGSLVELDRRARELAGLPGANPSHLSVMTDDYRLLLDFSDPTTAQRFVAVDDRVMGGVSQSRLRPRGAVAAFEGELSVERNGGFASVRSDAQPVDLAGFEGIALHVRGDGRTYKLRMRTDEAFDGASYQASFATTADVWTTIRLPFEAFRPTFRGRVLTGVAPLDPSAVRSFGLLVADEQVGAFRLELGWIGAYGER